MYLIISDILPKMDLTYNKENILYFHENIVKDNQYRRHNSHFRETNFETEKRKINWVARG